MAQFHPRAAPAALVAVSESNQPQRCRTSLQILRSRYRPNTSSMDDAAIGW